MDPHLSSILTIDGIRAVSKAYGYSNEVYVENLVMNFKFLHIIAPEIDCVVRGGMCIPLYTPDGSPHRLSVDIDLMTGAPPSEAAMAMDRVTKSNPELRIMKKQPKRPYPMDNLLTYIVRYMSVFGASEEIKVDFLCDMNAGISAAVMQNPKLFGRPIGYPIMALSRGELVGDKVTTLALGKIGLPERKYDDIPKQIYDIGSQLRLSSAEDVGDALEAFAVLTRFKADKYRHDPPYTVEEILNAVSSSLDALFYVDGKSMNLESAYRHRLERFKGMFLGKGRYDCPEHLIDILLVAFLAKLLKKYIKFPRLKDGLSRDAAAIIGEINGMARMRRDKFRDKRKQILADRPDVERRFGKVARGFRPEHIILFSEIHREG